MLLIRCKLLYSSLIEEDCTTIDYAYQLQIFFLDTDKITKRLEKIITIIGKMIQQKGEYRISASSRQNSLNQIILI